MIFVLCSFFLIISVVVDLGLKKIMFVLFCVVIKDDGRNKAIASLGKRQMKNKC